MSMPRPVKKRAYGSYLKVKAGKALDLPGGEGIPKKVRNGGPMHRHPLAKSVSILMQAYLVDGPRQKTTQYTW